MTMIFHIHRVLVLWMGGLLLLSGCDLLEPEPFEPDVVIESYQIAGEALQPVRLSRSVSIDEAYDVGEEGLSGAEVQVERLGENGDVEAVYSYAESGDSAGLYLAPTATEVLPQSRYRLRVEVEDLNESITAETVVPDTFSVLETTADTVVYQQSQASVTLTKSRAPERQSIYVFTTEAQAIEEENLSPFYRSIYDASEEELSLQDLSVTSSGALNEANFSVDENEHIHVDFPWIAVAFYEENRVRISVVDDNYYDYIRSQQLQQGGFGFSPGEIPNVITNVEGATGLFGSFAQQEFDVYVLPPALDAPSNELP